MPHINHQQIAEEISGPLMPAQILPPMDELLRLAVAEQMIAHMMRRGILGVIQTYRDASLIHKSGPRDRTLDFA